MAPKVLAQNDSIDTILHKHGEVIVRVYFDDEADAKKIGAGLEPMESNYEKGYLVFHLTQEEHDNLTTALADTGMSLALDSALTRKYVTHLQPVIQAPFSRSQSSVLQQDGGFLQAAGFDAGDYATIQGFSCYRTVEGTFATAQDIVTAYPNLATWTDVGDSWEKTQGRPGYDMMVLKLTNSAVPGPKPKVFFTSSIHAREYTTAELMTRFAVSLVEGYDVDADTTWVLDNHEIHLMLTANPDGRKQAETGILWRKNTNENYCSPTSNVRGADLNRNFSFEWNCCGGSSTSQCSTTFHGAGPASEPETQAVIAHINNNFPDSRGPDANDAAPLDTMGIYVDVHSSGRLILWPWGSTANTAPNGTQLQTLGRKLAFFNGHTPQQSIGLYPTDGTTTSFAYGEMGLPSYTYELGTQFFENCSYFENTLIPDNMPSLAYLIKTARAAYQLPAGPDVINQSTSPSSPVPAGTIVTLSATATDQRFNNSNGTEPTQTIASADYFVDVPPWSVSPAPASNPMSPADGSFNSGVEAIEASIDTTGWTEGRHTVYIQSTDSATNSNTGVVSAVFITIDNNAVLPTIVFEDDFETNKGWTTNEAGTDTATTGQWQRANPESTNSGGAQQLGTTVSGSFDLVTGPLAGTSVGTHDIDNGVTSILSPPIDIPASASSVDLSFYYYMAHLNNATSADFFRATVIGESSSTVVLEELGEAAQDNASWQQQTFDITAFADQTINILFEAADAGGGSLVEAAVDDVEITATVGNQAPDITIPDDQSTVEGSSGNLLIVATDPESDPITFSSNNTLPDGLSINSSTGLISGIVSATPQTFVVEITATDNQSNAASVTFDWIITPNNVAPVITNPGPQSSDEGDQVNLSIVANDDDGDTLGYGAQDLPPGLSINSTSGQITGTLGFNSAGTYNAIVTVSDPFFAPTVSFQWVVANINRAPSFDAVIPNQSNTEGETVNLSVSATDPDADTLTYSSTGSPLPDGLSINSTTGLISGVLSGTSAGNYNIEVSVSDGTVSVMQSFDWSVADVNLPPTLTNPGAQTDQQTAIISLQMDADDPDGDSLTFTQSGLPAGLNIDSNSGLISGTISASPGSYNVTIEVDDGNNPLVDVSFIWTVTDVSSTQDVIYVSSTSGGNVGGVAFSDEDILAFDTETESWSMYIDGSDVGLSGSNSRDINAFTFLSDNSIVFSVIGATTIPDVGSVDDSDLIRFIPTSTGSTTTGSFELYTDGSDVDLTSNGEDVDGVYVQSNGNILFSTIGGHNVSGIGGSDEDLKLFTPTSIGANTAGTWSVYFDGSDVGLGGVSSEDVYATWLDEANGDIYLSTRGSFSVTGLTGDGADIFICTPSSIGSTTACSYSLYWDGSTFGYGGEILDGLYIQR